MRGQWIGALFAILLSAQTAAVADGPDAAPLANDTWWYPQVAPTGPVVIVVSLVEQRAYVYRNGIAIGTGPVSSGKRRHATPAGVFTILQKEREHRSNLYDDAPMPFMERLTWDGVAIHAGTLPGYPASHGCIRMPHAFAEWLFGVTRKGDTVVVSDRDAIDPEIIHPSVLAPVTPLGTPDSHVGRAASFWWEANAKDEGPVSILISLADRRAYVMRNGLRIGVAPVDVAEGLEARGAVVYVAQEEQGGAARSRSWLAVPLRGDLGRRSMDSLAAYLKVADEFREHVRSVIAAGTTVLVTDQPALRGDTEAQILQSDSGTASD